MVQNDAHTRIQSGGTLVSSRTVAHGMAWTVPFVAVATAAPAYATFASLSGSTSLTFAGACKLPGNSRAEEGLRTGYGLKFLISSNLSCATKVTITDIASTGPALSFGKNPIIVPVGASSFPVFLDCEGDNSGDRAFTGSISYTFEDSDGETSAVLTAPFTVHSMTPECGSSSRF